LAYTVRSIDAKLDGNPVSNGDVINLLDLALGQHTMVVSAEDTAQNPATLTLNFAIEASTNSLCEAIIQLSEEGEIEPNIVTSLLAKCQQAADRLDRGKFKVTCNVLSALMDELNDLAGEKVTVEAASLLVTDIQAIMNDLECHNGLRRVQ